MKRKGKFSVVFKGLCGFLAVLTAVFCIFVRFPQCFSDDDTAVLTAAAFTLSDGTVKAQTDETKAVEKTFETDIDRYMLLNDEALSVICDSFGGVNFAVPEGLKGLNEGTQFLDSGFILKLISNPKFAEDARTVATGNLFADMLSGASGTRVADIAEYTYNKVINMVETDITSIDYENQKKAVDYIFRSNQYISTYRVPSGKPSGDGIALDPSSLKQIKNDSGLQ